MFNTQINGRILEQNSQRTDFIDTNKRYVSTSQITGYARLHMAIREIPESKITCSTTGE